MEVVWESVWGVGESEKRCGKLGKCVGEWGTSSKSFRTLPKAFAQ